MPSMKTIPITSIDQSINLDPVKLASYGMNINIPIGASPFSLALCIDNQDRKTVITSLNPSIFKNPVQSVSDKTLRIDETAEAGNVRVALNEVVQEGVAKAELIINTLKDGYPIDAKSIKLGSGGTMIVSTDIGKVSVSVGEISPDPSDRWAKISMVVVAAAQDVNVPSFSDSNMCAGVILLKGPASIELTGILRRRIEELMGKDLEQMKISNDYTWRVALGLDLAAWLKAKIEATPESQEASLSGTIERTGTGHSLVYKKSRIEGEWSRFINEYTRVEISQRVLKKKSLSSGITVGYAQHEDTVEIKNMFEVKSFDRFFSPKIYLLLSPEKSSRIYAEIHLMVREGKGNGLGESIEIEDHGLKLSIASEAAGGHSNTYFSIGFKIPF